MDITQQKMLQWYIFYPITTDRGCSSVVKMQYKLVFFLLPHVIHLSGFDFYSLFNFS